MAAASWQWQECGGRRRPAAGGRRLGGGAHVAVARFRQVPHDLYLHLEDLLRARVRGAALRRLLRSRLRHRLDRHHLAGAPLASKVHRAKPTHTDRVIQVDGVVGQHVKRRVGLVYLLRIGPGVRVAIIRHRRAAGRAACVTGAAASTTKEGRFTALLKLAPGASTADDRVQSFNKPTYLVRWIAPSGFRSTLDASSRIVAAPPVRTAAHCAGPGPRP